MNTSRPFVKSVMVSSGVQKPMVRPTIKVSVEKISIRGLPNLALVMIPIHYHIDLSIIIELVKQQKTSYMSIVNYDDKLNTIDDVVYNSYIYSNNLAIIRLDDLKK